MAGQIGFGPLYRVDGPLPLPPVYGLLQAMAAPAAGVRLVIDKDDYDVEGVDISSMPGMSIDDAIAELKRAGSIPESAGDLRWLNGVAVYPYPPGAASDFNQCGSGTDTTKDFGLDLDQPMFNAITVYLAETCASYKVPSQAEFKARAVTALNAVQSSGVARNLLTGEACDAGAPFLADGSGSFPNGNAATSPINGLSILEQEIGLTGKLGLIHCSPGMVNFLAGRFQIDNKTGVLRTFTGNVVIPDAGYARDPSNAGYGSPEGRTPSSGTEEWMYATGPIDIRLSEMFVIPDDVEQALDRGTPNGATTGRPNRITYRAERHALASWDTELQSAVLVDKCFTTCAS